MKLCSPLLFSTTLLLPVVASYELSIRTFNFLTIHEEQEDLVDELEDDNIFANNNKTIFDMNNTAMIGRWKRGGRRRGRKLTVGRTDRGIARGLLHFSLLTNHDNETRLPEDAQITAASLEFKMRGDATDEVMTDDSLPVLQLHETTKPWEKPRRGFLGKGRFGDDNDVQDELAFANWTYASFPDSPWDTSGGDYGDSLGGSVLQQNGTLLVFESSDALVQLFQSYFDGDTPHHGFLLRSAEAEADLTTERAVNLTAFRGGRGRGGRGGSGGGWGQHMRGGGGRRRDLKRGGRGGGRRGGHGGRGGGRGGRGGPPGKFHNAPTLRLVYSSASMDAEAEAARIEALESEQGSLEEESSVFGHIAVLGALVGLGLLIGGFIIVRKRRHRAAEPTKEVPMN